MPDSFEIDARYVVSRTPDQTFEMPRYPSLTAWQERATWLQRHILIVLGLWPLPTRTPLKPQILSRREYDDHYVERICFESWPGFLCTGNLYRPKGGQPPYPAVLNPHGHSDWGRLQHGERFSVPARCVALARMGMVAFSYDMVGYNDSKQVPRHRYLSLRSSLWGLSPMALQTWNSIRALDYLQTLEEVDGERIGCTGASGGGTQTFFLTAVDPRVKVAAPVNMISAHFQGGCVCENAPGLRTDTFNVEIAALAAPRPMLLVSATGDWTVNTPRVEYPMIQRIYALYGAQERLGCEQVDAGHNYNAESRRHVYRWFARWLLGDADLGESVDETLFDGELEALPLFDQEPPRGFFRGHELAQELERQVAARQKEMLPETRDDLHETRFVTETRLSHLLGVEALGPGQVWCKAVDTAEGGAWRRRQLELGRCDSGDRIDAAVYEPKNQIDGRRILLVHGAGEQGLLDVLGQPGEVLRAQLRQGYQVWTLDPLYTGPVPAGASARRDQDWFWSSFNRPLLGERVQDVLTVLACMQRDASDQSPALVGLGEAGVWALLAAGLSTVPDRIAADLACLRSDRDDAYARRLFAPAFCAYGGVDCAIALVAPRPLMLYNCSARFDDSWVKAAYRVVGRGYRLAATLRPLRIDELMNWLASQWD